MKKSISLLIAMIMCFTMLVPVSVFAAGTATFTIGSISDAKVGDVISVPITLTTSDVVNSISLLEMTYDEEILEFVDFEDHAAIDALCSFKTWDSKWKEFMLGLTASTKFDASNGTLCTVKFKVLKEGTATISAYEVSAKNNSDVFTSTLVEGKVEVPSASAAKTATYTIGSVEEAKVGDVISIPVKLNTSDVINSISFLEMTYDENVLEFVDFTDHAAIDALCSFKTWDSTWKEFMLGLTTSTKFDASNETLCTLQFKVIGAGTATISAVEVAAKNNSDVFETKLVDGTVTAVAGEVAVSGITLDKATASVEEGETVELKATVTPADATDPTVTWETSDAEVATVANGIVTTNKAGTVTITAKAGEKSATCVITVTAKPVAAKTATYTIGSVAEAKVGDVISIPVKLNTSDVINSISFLEMTYDENVLEFVDFADHAAIDALCSFKTWDSKWKEFMLGLTTSTKFDASNEILCTLQFKVIGAGTATISAVEVAAKNNSDVFETELVDGTVTAVAGEVAVSGITLDKATASVEEGETVELKATVTPADATDPTVTWETSDSEVATVANGIVTTNKAGTVTITAKAGEKSATCVITVTAKPVAAKTATYTIGSVAEAKVGDVISIPVKLNTSDVINSISFLEMTYDENVLEFVDFADHAAIDALCSFKTWDSTWKEFMLGLTTSTKFDASNETLCTLQFKVIGAGTATISAVEVAAKNNSDVFETKLVDGTVTAVAGEVAVSGITLDKETAKVTEGETVTLEATVEPSDATDKTVTWETSDAEVATVANGVVTTIKAGTVTITAKAGDFSATCVITVDAKVIPVAGITLDKETAKVTEGETVTLEATVTPDDATDKTITWETSDATIATVADGVVTTIKAGTVTITAKAGDKEATCVITVDAKVIPVTSITLDKATATLEVSKDLTLVATVEPADATDKTVTWETSDATIATVVDGKVVALKEGTVTITAKAGDEEATCVITVERLTGDINGDGAVALDDAILLFNYSMAPDLFPVNYEKEMDLNGDGAVSLSDAILLFNFSVAPEIFALN